MERIVVKVEVSQTADTYTVDLENLGLTAEEWENLSQGEKESALQTYIDDLPSQPFWVIDDFYEE